MKVYNSYASTLAGPIDLMASQPLDNRVVVENYNDLFNDITWKSGQTGAYNYYLGMIAVVLRDSDSTKRGPYWLKSVTRDQNDNLVFDWEKCGGGGGGDLSNAHTTTINLNGSSIVVVNKLDDDYVYSDPFRWESYSYTTYQP